MAHLLVACHCIQAHYMCQESIFGSKERKQHKGSYVKFCSIPLISLRFIYPVNGVTC
jgi:hypothetical protein